MISFWPNAIALSGGDMIRLFTYDSAVCLDEAMNQFRVWSDEHELAKCWITDDNGRDVYVMIDKETAESLRKAFRQIPVRDGKIMNSFGRFGIFTPVGEVEQWFDDTFNVECLLETV